MCVCKLWWFIAGYNKINMNAPKAQLKRKGFLTILGTDGNLWLWHLCVFRHTRTIMVQVRIRTLCLGVLYLWTYSIHNFYIGQHSSWIDCPNMRFDIYFHCPHMASGLISLAAYHLYKENWVYLTLLVFFFFFFFFFFFLFCFFVFMLFFLLFFFVLFFTRETVLILSVCFSPHKAPSENITFTEGGKQFRE